jgi:hypothetical protein
MSLKNSGDNLVDAKAILEAIAELKRRGRNTVMQELESLESELASFVMEELSLIHKTLSGTGAKSKLIRRLIVQVESITLVTIVALRRAQHRLWSDGDAESSPPAELDSSSDSGCELSPH